MFWMIHAKSLVSINFVFFHDSNCLFKSHFNLYVETNFYPIVDNIIESFFKLLESYGLVSEVLLR